MNQKTWTMTNVEERHRILKSIGVADSMRNPRCEYYSKLNWKDIPDEIKEKFELIRKEEAIHTLEECNGFYSNKCEVCNEKVKIGDEGGMSFFLETDGTDSNEFPTCKRCIELKRMQEKGITL